MGDLGRDDAAFERWYREEHPRLVAALTVSAGSQDVARDLAAEAFSRALERWERVAAMEAPAGWVRQVAFNLLRRRLRRSAMEARLLRYQRPPEVESPSPVIDPELWTVVLALPPRQRAVLGLRVVLDLSQEETARLLGIRPGTVSAALVAARRNAARALGGGDRPAFDDERSEVEHG